MRLSAAQAYVASVAINTGQADSVKALNGFSFILRRTGDIDVSFDGDPVALVNTFNLIVARASPPYSLHSFPKRFVMQGGQYPFDAEGMRSILKSVDKGEQYDLLAKLMESSV